ncbi:structural maintenance of chromosomes protein 6 [Bactrocera tryoni]|uniref:structural maintenance of chromosomes protein 6 n=1 Tax=Bactrocera tryoni TaxID=59916 RepID=UPI001A99B9BF|nr:structural maintenance of chromosomes protein 6 [Bactrocera tryoni]XP_039959965.1 structural maintenance of chromosomes protein 6 [Bactrocera tryoni]
MSLSLCRKRRVQDHNDVSNISTNSTVNTQHRSARQRRRDELPSENVGNEAAAQEDAPTSSQAKRQKRSEGTLSNSQIGMDATRCGKIKKVVLVNFMCHAHYCIELHPRVNFMVGRNGCGKSAILAALVVGMGGRARATNRSTSLHSLIRNGQHSARVEITISNEGVEAFRPEIYGDEITIVRAITQSASNYKIKNASGRVVSEKFDELKRIMDIHNIQVDNPAFVMNQDSAREFLKDMEPKKNYQLFLKATQLDSIQEQLIKCYYEYQDHKQRLMHIEKKLEEDQQNIAELETEYRKILSFAQLKQETNQKKAEYEWSLVNQLEMAINKIEEAISEAMRDRDKLEEQANRKNEIENKLKAEMDTCREVIGLNRTEYDQKKDNCQAINTRLKEKAKVYHGLNIDMESLKKRIHHLESLTTDLEQNIAQRSKTMGVEELRRRNEAELETLRREQAENKAMNESDKREYEIFAENKSQKEEEFRNIKIQIDNSMRRIDGIKREISNLQANKRNRYSIYGQEMQTLLEEIDRQYRARKFSERPRGPIGSYLDVPEQKYRNVVENQIADLLRAFIVNNTADRTLLNTIIQQRCPNMHVTIITAKFLNRVHDVRAGCVRPPAGTRLLYDVIQCRDPVVMNCLIDQLSIETILLTDTKQTAEHLTIQQEQVPQNLRKIIVDAQPALEYFPAPKYRMYSLNIRPARLIQMNVDECISQLNDNYRTIENERLKLQEAYASTGRELRTSLEQFKEKQTLMQKHRDKIMRLEQRIADLEGYEYPNTNELCILQKELAENESKLEQYKSKLEDKKRECADVELEKQNIEIEMRKHTDKLEGMQRNIREKENELNKLQMDMRTIQDNFLKFEDKKRRIDERIHTEETNKSVKLKELNDKKKVAQKFGQRVQTERTPDEILDEIKLGEVKLKQGAPLKEDPDKLENAIKRLKRKLSVDRSTLKTFTLVTDQLKQSHSRRMYFVKHFKGHMITMLQYTFNNVLSKRRFTGKIEVNHKEQTMEISVVPRDNHIADAVTNTRSLSGGERSYTTVAFLISLWACVDHPFFFLDEYDVFADEVNREYMTRLLKFEGQKRPNRQFVFLTPQDMSIEACDYIRIHRLAEPIRN